MKRQQFLLSKQLKLNLLTTQKKLMQLRHRYVIEVITDNHVDQVKKTFREFQYFNKILHKKLGLKDKLLYLGKHLRSNNNYRDLELFIQRLNSGYLIYRSIKEPQQESRRNAQTNLLGKGNVNQVLQLQPTKTKELRNYLFDLLYREDELFVDGVDDEESSDQLSPQKIMPIQSYGNLKTQFKKDQSYQNVEKQSRNPLKKLWYAKPVEKAKQKIVDTEIGGTIMNQVQRAEVNINQTIRGKSKQRQKSDSNNKLKQAFLNLTNKAKNSLNTATQNYAQNKNIKSILKNITKCWIKFPNNYNTRDRNIIYKPYFWEQYDLRLTQNQIQFTNINSLYRNRKIFVIFECDVELNFQEYTKLVVKNKIDKNPLQIRLNMNDQVTEVTQEYLALYTYIKQTVKQQEEKLKAGPSIDRKNKVCNKVRVRLNLKQKVQKTSVIVQKEPTLPKDNLKKLEQPRIQKSPSQLFINIPHIQRKNDQKQTFQYKQLRPVSDNIKYLNVKIVHSVISIITNVTINNYIDVDFPILDNFGALDISLYEIPKQNSFLPTIVTKQALCTFHVPVQTIYDYIYNQDMPKKKVQSQLKPKMIQIKHTKANFTVDYKFIGNQYALCCYNENDIFQQDQPPEQFNRDQFRMNNNRLKRIIWTIQLSMHKFKDLKNFTYPNLSYIFYVLLMAICLVYDNNDFLIWILTLVLLVLLYNSPVYNVYVRDLVDFLKITAKKNRLDQFLSVRNKLIQQQLIIPNRQLSKIHFLRQFILTRKIKRSIYKKYKRLLQVLLHAQIILTKFVSIIQKIKNILTWYHYKKTKLLFLIILGLIFIMLIFPIRLILILLILKTMKKGITYHNNIQDINRIIIIQLIRIIIRQNNLNNMNLYFKQHYRPFQYRNQEIVSFISICNKLLSDWLDVTINMNVICNKSKNMAELFINLSKCKTKYKIKKQICQLYGFSLEWSKTESSVKKYFDVIYGFIVTMPSDKYIMGVKTVSGNEDQEIQQADNIIDRQLLNF